jgi:hypothetical protein
MDNDTGGNMTQAEEFKAAPSLEDVCAAIKALFTPDQVIELRALGFEGVKEQKKVTYSGYYDDHELLARDAVKLSETPGVFGVYFTLQTLNPAVLLRYPNKYRKVKPGECSSDADVVSYRWLCVDLDPKRPTGISSTEEEKARAHDVMLRVSEFFESQGIRTLEGDSGNGYHDLARINVPVKDKDLVRRAIAGIADRFGTDDVDIDLSVFNPSRIWKVYGTVAAKGESSPERPHRTAKLLTDAIPNIVSRELLEQIAGDVPAETTKHEGKKASKHQADWATAKLEEFMKAAHIEHGPAVPYKDGHKWTLDTCVFNPEHTGGCAIVTMAATSALGYRCLHNSCFGKTWAAFREYGEGVIGHKFEFKEKGAAIDPDAIVCAPGRLTEMVRQSEIVLDNIRLKYFERSGNLVNVSYGRDVEELKDVDRDGDSVVIQSASDTSILRDLDRKARYVKRLMTKDGPIDIRLNVPKTMPAQIKDRVRSQPREVPFPSLSMVTGSPVLLPSGKVHDYQSLFEESVLFVNAHTDYYPRVSDFPTREDALAALAKFHPIFEKFPFTDPDNTGRTPLATASYSVVLSGCLSLASRAYMGIGAVPIHGVTAHAPRSGKTKIVEAACAAMLGHRPTAVHFTSEEEFSKHLLPLMQAGDRAILIDNVERSLESSKLCILITGGTMRDRVLGESRDVLLRNFAVFWATGNNLIIGGDLTARAIRCDIDPQMELPESRSFEFDPVKRAQEEHPQLVTAALTILRAYLVAGMPWTLKRAQWGGFVRWDKLVCGALTWLDMADPFESRLRIANDDPVRSGHLDILEEWWEEYHDKPVSFRKIQKDRGTVYEILLKGGEWNGYYARWLLSRLLGKTVNGLTLVRTAGKSEYQILKAGEERSFDEVAAYRC